MEAGLRKNCAAVIKEYGKKHLRGLLQGGAVPCKADFPVTVPSDSEMHKSERQNSAQIEIVLHGYFQKSRKATNTCAKATDFWFTKIAVFHKIRREKSNGTW